MLHLQERSAAGSARSTRIFSRTVQILAELLITAGVVLVLFIAWQLWRTNLESDASQREVIGGFAQEFKGSGAPLAQAAAVDYGPAKVFPEPAAEPCTRGCTVSCRGPYGFASSPRWCWPPGYWY